MKSNQSLHITVKEPPNPEPVRSLGALSSLDSTTLLLVINKFLVEEGFTPKDAEFLQNCREEALKAITLGTVLTAARENGHTYIVIKDGT